MFSCFVKKSDRNDVDNDKKWEEEEEVEEKCWNGKNDEKACDERVI